MNDRAVNPTPAAAPKCPQCGTPLPTGGLAGLCPACLLQQGAAADTVTEGKQPPFTPPPAADLAPLFPQLEMLELIGKGGMGAVYKARQKQLDRIVALKILPPGIGDDPAFAERFAREARALAKLNHPGIVTLYEFGRADLPPGLDTLQRVPTTQLYYFLMEFVDGVNLRQLLHAGRVSPREALAIVPQICDALQFAHDLGIVHRDIKPENILLDRRGRVKVADFGLAKIVGTDAPLTPSLSPSDGERVAVRPGEGISALTVAGKIMGTPNYMAPEQVSHPAEVDHRADIYALGVVFYQMLTGELPGQRLEPPSRKVQIDVRLDEVVLRALEKNPEHRFQQVSEVKTCMETIAATSPGSSRREEAQTEPVGNPVKQSRRALAITEWPRIIRRAATVGLVVWLITVAMITIVTFLLPESYRATARIKVDHDKSVIEELTGNGGFHPYDPYFIQTEFEVIQSQLVLEPVIQQLNLERRWSERYAAGQKLGLAETLQLLKNRLELRPVRSTMLIDIGVFSELRDEPAELANAIAESYVNYRTTQLSSANEPRQPTGIDTNKLTATQLLVRAVIVEKAIPPQYPARPNRPLNIALGAVAGVFLGGIAGFISGMIAWRKHRPTGGSSANLIDPALTATTQRHGRLAFGLFLAGTLGTLLLMTISPRHELALIFGGVALVLAFLFGLMSWREWLGKFVVIALASVLAVVAVAVLVWLAAYVPARQASEAAHQRERMKLAEAIYAQEAGRQPGKLSFGPVIERTIPIPRRDEPCVLDFESGELLTPPDELAEKLAKNRDAVTGDDQSWMSAYSADIYVKPGWSKCSLMTLECVAANQDETGRPLIWDELTPVKLTAALAPMQSFFGHGFFYSDIGAATNAGKVFGFVTRERSMGILEITGFTDNPRGVKIRYKLVQTSPGLKTSASLEAANASDGDSRRSGSTGLLRPDTTIRAAGGKVIVDDANGRLTADQVTLGPSNTLTATGSNIMYEVRGKPATK